MRRLGSSGRRTTALAADAAEAVPRHGLRIDVDRNGRQPCSFKAASPAFFFLRRRAGLRLERQLNPIALISFTSRVGPWLGREIAKKPALLTSLIRALQVGGKFVGTKLSDVLVWVKLNPGNAVMLASTLASLGYSVASLFGDSKDPEVIEFKNGLSEVAQRAAQRIDAIGASSETETHGSASTERAIQDEVAIEALSWARGFCGSIPAAIEFHRMLQAFIEMPLTEVRRGFAVYKLQ